MLLKSTGDVKITVDYLDRVCVHFSSGDARNRDLEGHEFMHVVTNQRQVLLLYFRPISLCSQSYRLPVETSGQCH
jgi:hypothetical protein